MTTDAFDWQGADSPDGYLTAVRGAFGSSLASTDAVRERLMPPMQSLQSVQIEVTTWCNFSCRECGRTKAIERNEWDNMHIPLERVRTVIEKLPRTRQIVLQGIGEPSMHPHFAEIVRLAAESGKFDSIHFNTNGHTHDDQFWKDLARHPGMTVALSLDSLDPTIAQRCRAGTDIETLWARLQLFADTFTWFIVALVASRINLADIETTLRKIALLGKVPVQITCMMSDDSSVLMDEGDESWLAERIANVRREFPAFDVYFNPQNTGFSGLEKRCVAPFLSPFVRADGYLTPCCATVDPAHYGYARADDGRDWDALRRDAGVVQWVSDFIGRDPAVCRGCSLNPVRYPHATNS